MSLKKKSVKTRFALSGMDAKSVDKGISSIIQVVKLLDKPYKGPVCLPTKVGDLEIRKSDKYTHLNVIHKAIPIHKRVIDISDLNEEDIQALIQTELPSTLAIAIVNL